MGARDKGSSLPILTLVPERKQIQYQPLNLSFSLSLCSDSFWEWEKIWSQRCLGETAEKGLAQCLVFSG